MYLKVFFCFFLHMEKTMENNKDNNNDKMSLQFT